MLPVARVDGLQLRLRLSQRLARMQPGDQTEVSRPGPDLFGFQNANLKDAREPNLGRRKLQWKLKIGGKDADHGDAFSVNVQASTENSFVAAKMAMPKTIADHRDVWSCGIFLVRQEIPSSSRGDAQHLKKIFRDERAGEHLRLSLSRESYVPRKVRRSVFQRAALLVDLAELCKGKRNSVCLTLPIKLSNGNQPIRIGIGQGPQKHGIHDAEDRGVRANS